MSKVLPRVLAVHDMSGFGKCSLTVAIPVISACGAEVCPLPTALLSSSTNYEGWTFSDFTPQMPKYIEHWENMGLKADAIYSGFLGSAEQIDIIIGMGKKFSGAKMIIDPVMGDNGVVYQTYTPEMCAKMSELVAIADIATPNLTEACILTGEDYKTVDTSFAGIEKLTREIAKLGAKNVVITGIERGDILYNCCLEDGEYYEVLNKLYPKRMHGTGDLFTSVLTGGIVTGHYLMKSIESAAKFVYNVVKCSYEDGDGSLMMFEPFMYTLRNGVCEFDKQLIMNNY